MATDRADLLPEENDLGPVDLEFLDERKEHIRQLYMELTLEKLMERIRNETGFNATRKQWTKKLAEWGFVKNILAPAWQYILYKEAELALDGKATIFYYGGIEVTQIKIDMHKSRKSRAVNLLLEPPLPLHLEYEWPFLQGNRAVPRPERIISSFLLPPDTDTARTHTSGLPSHSLFNDLDNWLLNKARPWSHLALSCQLGHYSFSIPPDDNLPTFEKPRDLSFSFENANDSLNEICAGIGSFADCTPTMESEQADPGDTSVDEFFSIVGNLPGNYGQPGDYHFQELSIHFEVAKSLATTGRYEEAVHITRKIEAESNEVPVQALLGLSLAKTNHLEESENWFFIALTGFIVTFEYYSCRGNELRFDSIYELFEELNCPREKSWVPLIDCMNRMMVTFDQLKFEEDIREACPQMFIHGVSIAYQCFILGMNSSAKILYQYLLEHPWPHFYLGHYALQKGIAHQVYGLLLMLDKDWTLSADHLRQACKSIMKCDLYSIKIVQQLTEHYEHLCPYLATRQDQKDALDELLKEMLECAKYRSFAAESYHESMIGDYFSNPDLPRALAVFRLEAISHSTAVTTFPARTSISSVASQRDVYLLSTAVMSEVLRVSPRVSVRGSTDEGGYDAMALEYFDQDEFRRLPLDI